MEGGCNSKHYWLMELLLDRTNYFNRFFDDFLYVKISGPRRFFILFSCENGKVQISISSVSQTKQLVTESGNRDQILHATSLSLFSNFPGPLQITSCVKSTKPMKWNGPQKNPVHILPYAFFSRQILIHHH